MFSQTKWPTVKKRTMEVESSQKQKRGEFMINKQTEEKPRGSENVQHNEN